MAFEMRLSACPVYSVKTRVIMELQQFPGGRYGFRAGEAYKLLEGK